KEKGDLLKSGDFLIDKIKLGNVGFKERYYKDKFSVEGSTNIELKRKEIVQKYTEGLLWVLQYYFSGVASWTWFYPYHYGPFASDLKGMGQVKVNFEKGVPFLPFDQLLSVLPQRSSYALPKAYAQLMLDEQSKIFDLFPQSNLPQTM
ncbi:5'-3' exoribonuclease, partial [Trifolium medium]|nr:5'-3' exoribonuclease [Trifolium medium]